MIKTKSVYMQGIGYRVITNINGKIDESRCITVDTRDEADEEMQRIHADYLLEGK